MRVRSRTSSRALVGGSFLAEPIHTLLLIDVASRGLSGKEASQRLENNGIIANKNTIPYDPRPPMDPSGVRLGTPALTTRGMKEKEMKIIARLLNDVLGGNKNVKREVIALCKKFPVKSLNER